MLYNGDSESFKQLFIDYFDYAKSVNTSRSFPDVRDGLKPVHRRILYSLGKSGKKGLSKSSYVVGLAMEYHPHGDASIYDALTLMTENNGSWNVPVIQSAGSWGKVYSSEARASAPRYTESGLNKWGLEMLEDISHTPFQPREVGEGSEPEVLPSKYPFMLTVGHSGMGVGLSTKIPSFNFWDILELTRVYLQNNCEGFDDAYIFPDFPTGGEIEADPAEALKLMYSGTARFNLRASYSIDSTGTMIQITEVPYGSSAEKLASKIQELELSDVRNALPSIGINGCGVTIICRKGKAPDVERVLFHKGILQVKYSSFMVWTVGEECRQGGVYSVIEEWVKFRKEVLTSKLNKELEGISSELERLSYFTKLLASSNRDVYMDKVVNHTRADADGVLLGMFSEIPAEVRDWIYSRRLNAFNRGSKYQSRYEDLLEEKRITEGKLANLNQTILDEFDELEAAHAGLHERRTALSDVRIITKKTEQIEPTRVIYIPSTGVVSSQPADMPVPANSLYATTEGKPVIGITLDGHLIKFWADKLDKPQALYDYAGFDSPIIAMLEPSHTKWILLYKDGRYSTLNLDKFTGGRRTRVKKDVFSGLDNILTIIPEGKYGTVTHGFKHGEDVYAGTVSLKDLGYSDRPKYKSELADLMGYRWELVGFDIAEPHPYRKVDYTMMSVGD